MFSQILITLYTFEKTYIFLLCIFIFVYINYKIYNIKYPILSQYEDYNLERLNNNDTTTDQSNIIFDESTILNGVVVQNSHIISNQENCNPTQKLFSCQLDDLFSCRFCKSISSKCVHFDENTDVINEGSQNINMTIPKNLNKNDGYCMNMLQLKNSRTCNPNTGTWILVRHMDKLNKIEAFLFICKCRYPHLIGQKTIMDDCDVSNGCGDLGQLEDVTVNPMIHGVCKCNNPDMYEPTKSSTGVPICGMKSYTNWTKDPIEVLSFPFLLPITSPAISPQFQSKFINSNRFVINPCNIDAFTGEPIEYAKLTAIVRDGRWGTKTGETSWFCQPTRNNVATVLYSSDFLKNNNGTWANGVYLITSEFEYMDVIVSEWNLSQQSAVGENGSYNPPVFGVRVHYEQLTDPLKLYLKEWKNQHDRINFYSFMNHIFILPHLLIKDYNSYKELYNDMDEMPVDQMFIPPLTKKARYFVYEFSASDRDRFWPRNCWKMFINGSDAGCPKWVGPFNGTYDSEKYEKLLYGKGYMGCILNKDDKFPNITKQNELFIKIYGGYYVLNDVFQNNTTCLEFYKPLSKIRSVWYGTKSEENEYNKYKGTGIFKNIYKG